LNDSPSVFFHRVAFSVFFSSLSSFSAKISDICIYTLAEKLEPGYGLLYYEASKSVQRVLINYSLILSQQVRNQFVHCYIVSWMAARHIHEHLCLSEFAFGKLADAIII